MREESQCLCLNSVPGSLQPGVGAELSALTYLPEPRYLVL